MILYADASAPDIYQYQQASLDDDGEAVTWRATTATWAPNNWHDEAVIRTAVVVVSSNVGADLRITPIVNGVKYDGTNGNPDSRVTFTIPTPAAGERLTARPIVGLYRPIVFEGDGTVLGRVGLRGTYFQFQLDSIGAVVVPSGELNPDFRFEGVEFDPAPARRTQQVVNP